MSSQYPLLLGLHAETSLHAGTGASLGVIDLPIQREAHTGYPVVFGSAVKDALRAHAAAKHGNTSELVTTLFGPEKVGDDSAHAGALLIGDARLAALPIRSLTSQFKWVTCPYLLQRLFRDAERLGVELKKENEPALAVSELTEPEENALFGTKETPAVYLEEYRFEQRAEPGMIEMAAAILASLSGIDGLLQSLQTQLVIVRNDDFSYLCRAAVPVTPHVALDSATKTANAETGALWYEETLPPETLLYVPIIAQDARAKDKKREAQQNANDLISLFESDPNSSHEPKAKPYLQLGGNETVGMGWCRTRFIPAKEGQ